MAKKKVNGWIDEAKAASVVKEWGKIGSIAACNVGGDCYVTNSKWIMKFDDCHKKVMAAIVEAVGPISVGEYCSGVGFKSEIVVARFKEICDAKRTPAELTKWLYDTEPELLRVVNTPDGPCAFNDDWVSMFKNCEIEVATLDSPKKDSKILVFVYREEPVGVIMECRIDFTSFPQIREEEQLCTG